MNSRLYKQLKIALTVLFITGALNFGQGQTYFGLTGSYGWANTEPGPSLQGAGYSHKWHQEMLSQDFIPGRSFYAIGILAEQQLSTQYSLGIRVTLNSDLEVLSYPAWKETWILQGYRFKSWQNRINIRRKVLKGLYLSGGVDLAYLFATKSVFYLGGAIGRPDKPIISTPSNPRFRNNLQYSAVLSAAYRYDRFMLELSYQKGLGFRSKDDYFLQPIDALSLSLYCLFKAPWGKRAAEPWF